MAEITHAEGCWSWGPAHFMCAHAEIKRLKDAMGDRTPAALLTTWVSETEAVTEPLYKAPRRLTDSEIGEVWFAARIHGLTETDARRLIRAAEQRAGVTNA